MRCSASGTGPDHESASKLDSRPVLEETGSARRRTGPAAALAGLRESRVMGWAVCSVRQVRGAWADKSGAFRRLNAVHTCFWLHKGQLLRIGSLRGT